jgi:hypothetical protein
MKRTARPGIVFALICAAMLTVRAQDRAPDIPKLDIEK